MVSRFAVVLCLFGCVLLAGCNQTSATSDRKIHAVCTTGMVADLVRQVGKDRVRVTQLMAAGVDPHGYKSSIHDLKLIEQADVVLYSGLHLEGKMTDVFKSFERLKIVEAVSNGIRENQVLEDEENQHDPHLWLDVAMWAQGLDVIRDALTSFDPDHREIYAQNSKAYADRLSELDKEVRQELATIPAERRVLVTAHDAFRYFGRAYAVEVRGIQGINTEEKASVGAINELVQFLAQRKIKAIFVESSVPHRNVQAVIDACKRDYQHTVSIGGELYSDAMGEDVPGVPDDQNPGTYVGMIKHNVTTIVKALK